MDHHLTNKGKSVILLLMAVFGLAAIGSFKALADTVDEDAGIQDSILRQIEAFANNDREQAWAFASEGVKQRFGSSRVFVDMVREAYPAIHSARENEFTDRTPHGMFQIQTVKLKGPEGKRWDVYYRMVSNGGEWKIAGVRLWPAELGI